MEPKPGKAAEDEDNIKAGQAEAAARQGDWAKARQAAAGLKEVARVRALGALAAAASEAKTGDVADLDALLVLAEGEMKGKVSSWLLLRLGLAGVRAGVADDRLQRLAAAVPDPAVKGRIQLEKVQTTLDADKGKSPDSVPSAVEASTLSHRRAWEALARHNVRHDSGTLKAVDGWEESQRPFGYVGAALGLLDGD